LKGFQIFGPFFQFFDSHRLPPRSNREQFTSKMPMTQVRL
jgi:hypothetical protein